MPASHPTRFVVLLRTAAFALSLARRLAAGARPHESRGAWRGPYATFDVPTYRRRRIRIPGLDAAA